MFRKIHIYIHLYLYLSGEKESTPVQVANETQRPCVGRRMKQSEKNDRILCEVVMGGFSDR